MEKKTILIGAGQIAEKEVSDGRTISGVADNNPGAIGTDFFGYSTSSVESIEPHQENLELIICTTSIREVRDQLLSLGHSSDSIHVSSYLKESDRVASLEEFVFSGFISSGLPSGKTKFSDGGIYRIQERPDGSVKTRKLYPANTHGMILGATGETLIFCAQGDGIVEIDLSGSIMHKIPIPDGMRPHGIARLGSNFVVASSKDDAILVLDKSGEVLDRFELSKKKERYQSPQHHCNDLCTDGSYIYASMFSISGNWKRGSFDGGIIEICPESGSRAIVKEGLTMPHNVSFIDKELAVLNSFKGEILLNNFEKFGVLPGFARGLDSSAEYIFAGESKNRNFSRLDTGRSPISIDSRITIIDKDLKCSRSVQLPRSISEIHAIVVCDQA